MSTDQSRDLSSLFAGWPGYGTFTPALDTLPSLVGRCDRIVLHRERTPDQIWLAVMVEDPDAGGYERGEGLRTVWSCQVAVERGEVYPSQALSAAIRDQQFIADRCFELLQIGKE